MTDASFTGLVRLRDDASSDAPAVTVDSFAEQSNAGAVRIEPGDDTRELLPHLGHVTRVEINFPSFTDGRGYSAAQILREAGYTGEIRAIGNVLRDQYLFMLRCGFDALEVKEGETEKDWQKATKAFSVFFQPAADDQETVVSLRHRD